MDTVLNVLQAHVEWSSATFPKGTAIGAMIHAGREVEEVISEMTPIHQTYNRWRLAEEYADVIGCVIDSANRMGIGPAEVFLALSNKLVINKQRVWKDNGDGSYSHVK